MNIKTKQFFTENDLQSEDPETVKEGIRILQSYAIFLEDVIRYAEVAQAGTMRLAMMAATQDLFQRCEHPEKEPFAHTKKDTYTKVLAKLNFQDPKGSKDRN